MGPKRLNKHNVEQVGPNKLKKINVEKVGLYMLIYLHIPPYTPEYLYIPSYTSTYINILHIQKMTANIRPQNGHKSSPRGFPMARIWHAPSYHIVKGFFTPKGPQFELN